MTRPDSISVLISRSERSTLATYRFRYDVGATAKRERHGFVVLAAGRACAVFAQTSYRNR